MSDRPSVDELSRLFLAVLGAARPATLADACAAADPARVVETSGAADGVGLTAPLSGRPCVWYRSVTSPFLEKMGTPSGGPIQRITPPPVVPSSAFPPQQASALRRYPQQIDTSSAVFRLGDGAASITVDPAHVLVDAAEVTINDYRRDETGRATALRQEWIIAPGEQLHAFGAVGRGAAGLELQAGPVPTAIVSSHDRADLTARAEYGVGSASPRKILAIILVPVVLVAVLIVLLIFGVL